MPQATPPMLRMLNVLLLPGARTRKDPDAAFEKLLAEAQRGHRPLGAADVAAVEPLRLLLRAHAANPDLSPFGWTTVQSGIRDRLRNRVVIRDIQARHPEVREQPVPEPVFVVGLPRTGTTFTYNVIARSPGTRGPLLWEMLNLGLPVEDPAERERIAERTTKRLSFMDRLSPDWSQIHPLIATSEEEDFFLRDHSELHSSAATVPEYRRYLAGADLTDDFLLLRDALQVLSFGQEPQRWILKHPANLWRMPEIQRAFPDARFVWTHRAPGKALASGCSMSEALRNMHYKPGTVDLAAIGAEWLAILSEGVDRALSQRDQLEDGTLVDVSYNDLVEEPSKVMRGVFKSLGMTWTDADEANLATARDRPHHKGHRYTLERYGLDEFQVAAAFAGYKIPSVLP
ncbi:sulfotransferase family protein [Myceligenerans salitolerans]|uniref:Sulfotransferase n=1 Tax=Myceligenerans salitolerans TaxID=1230528 RepID=A0ABS3I4E4_9MICO|nr:sulfotransferase [Myceligenerans salitolerans]MBO0607871.1 sulfotransferase [Myceligenerans salitolerans]